MSPRPLSDVTDTEVAYLQLVTRYGTPGPTSKRLDIQDPVADDGETDCWTHAWTVARRLDAKYVEGVCTLPGAGGPSMHAWVEHTTPFGSVVVETTPGYEHATDYRGIVIDSSPGGLVEQMTGGPDWAVRSSVLQASLEGARSAGVPAARVLATVRA